MSQRPVLRRGDMELSRSGFQRESATQTTGDGNEEVAIRAGSNLPTFSTSNSQRQQLQQLRGGEQDPLQLNSAAVTNRRFSLLDILRETFHLARARKTFLLVFLPIFIVGVILLQGFAGYLAFEKQHLNDYSSEVNLSCETKVLRPWSEAAIRWNLTSAKNDEFYTLFQQNCSRYKSPAGGQGSFTFRNGTMKYSPLFFDPAFPLTPTQIVVTAVIFMISMWAIWGQVAVTCGLHFATTRTMTYRPAHYRGDSMQSTASASHRLKQALRELFSFTVLQGAIRVTLTETLMFSMTGTTMFLIAAVRTFVQDKSETSLDSIENLAESSSRWWSLANPLPFLFLLSPAAAALEPGMWGFRALWRGIQLERGNWLKGYLLYLLLFFWSWLDSYLSRLLDGKPVLLEFEPDLLDFKPNQGMTKTLSGALWRSMGQGGCTAMGCLPGIFLVPVFYFLCKSWHEKLATMA